MDGVADEKRGKYEAFVKSKPAERKHHKYYSAVIECTYHDFAIATT